MHPVEHIGGVHGLARCIEFGFDALAAEIYFAVTDLA
jgi:hypothetical protein